MVEQTNDKLDYYLASLHELGEILIKEEQTQDVGRGILRLTLGTIMASKGAIFLYDTEKRMYFSLATQGFNEPGPLSSTPAQIEKLKYYSHGYILIEVAKKIFTKEMNLTLDSFNAKIVIPLFYRNAFLGVVAVGKKFMNEEYSQADIKVLEIIANHLTKALFNYQILQNLEDKQNQLNLKLLELETLFDISVAISSVLNVEDLREEILWRSIGVLNASKGMVLTPKENSPIMEISASFNWEDENVLLSNKLEVFSLATKEKRGAILTVKNKTAIQEKLGEENIIVAPLQAKDKNLGFMLLCNKETRTGTEPFNQNDMELLSALCNQAAVAIDNARLFKDITEEKQFNESILDSIATGVITLDTIGEIDSINHAGIRILNKEKKEILGNHYMFLFESDETITTLIQKTETEQKPQSEQNVSFLTASEETIVNISAAPRVDADNNVHGVVLAIEDITQQSKIKNTFKRYVSKQIVDQLLDDDARLNLGGEKRTVTILFTDIRGFTAMSEKMKPEELVSTLNEYFSEMIDIVFKNNGTLDKIVGDELMIVFGAPILGDDDTERAVRTAQEMMDTLKKLNKRRNKRGMSNIHIGIGINSGPVVSGNIGSRDMMDYTVIGDAVNLGARLCSNAAPGEIIASETVYNNTKDKFSFEKLEPIFVKGKKERVEIYKAI